MLRVFFTRCRNAGLRAAKVEIGVALFIVLIVTSSNAVSWLFNVIRAAL